MPSFKINIIILNWNGCKDTINCIKSVQKSDCTVNYKIIIIDNCSSDDSIEQITKAFPEIEIIQNDRNLGFGGGCNAGLQRSINDDVEFIWLLNNDTTVFPNSLQELLETADKLPNAGIIGSVLYYMDNPTVIQAWGGGYINFWSGSVKHINNSKESGKLQYITGASMLIRTKALREVGLFDDHSYFMYWEDADLCYRFTDKGWCLAVADSSIIAHKESSSFENNHHLLVRYFNQSAVVFFCRYYRFCVIPVFIGLTGRLIKRILYKDIAGFKEITRILRHQLFNAFLRMFR